MILNDFQHFSFDVIDTCFTRLAAHTVVILHARILLCADIDDIFMYNSFGLQWTPVNGLAQKVKRQKKSALVSIDSIKNCFLIKTILD